VANPRHRNGQGGLTRGTSGAAALLAVTGCREACGFVQEQRHPGAARRVVDRSRSGSSKYSMPAPMARVRDFTSREPSSKGTNGRCNADSLRG